MRTLNLRNMKPLNQVTKAGVGIHTLTPKSIHFTVALGCLIRIILLGPSSLHVFSFNPGYSLGVGGRTAILQMRELRLRKVRLA